MNATARRLSGLVLFFTYAVIANAGVNQWTPTGPEGGYARAAAFHPTQPGVAFTAAGAAIYRTTDYGQSWTAVRSDISNGGVTRIVIDPSNSNRVLAATIATVYLSNDAGLTFSAVSSPDNHGEIRSLVIAPTGGAIYVGRYDGRVFRSLDGLQWEERSTGFDLTAPGHPILDLVFDPGDANSIYALVDLKGVYHTTDAGLHWTLAGSPPTSQLLKLAVDPGRPQELLIASNQGLYASPDGGVTWSVSDPASYWWVGYHPGQPTSRIGAAVAIATNGHSIRRAGRGLAWVQTGSLKIVTVEDAAFDPTNLDQIDSTLLLATTDGPLLTTDGGQTFSVRPHGIRGAHAYHLTASNDGTIYAAYSLGPTGMYKRGATGADPWIPLNNADLRAKITAPFQPLSVVVDPNNAQTLFVASGTSVVRSTDGGQSWTPPHAEFSLNLIAPRVIAFDPSDSNVLYIGTDSHGLYRTQDKGVTWFQRSATPASLDKLLVDPSAPGTVYAGPFLSSPPSPPYLYKTTDGGMTMNPASSGLNTLAMALALNPANPQEVYAGGSSGNAQGLYRSTNSGQTWAFINGPTAPIMDLAIDPVVPTTMVAVMNAEGHGAARSVDGGATWERLDFQVPGGTYSTMRRVILDPKNPHIILSSSEGYGLVEFEVSPDLDITVLSSPATVALGRSAPASVRVLNKGPLSASAVELTLTMPTSVTATVSAPGQGTCSATGQVVHCSLGALKPAQALDLAFQINASTSRIQGSWSASVVGHESDPVSGNNVVTTTVSTNEVADARLALSGLPTGPIDRGSSVTLTATVTNAGPNSASNVKLVVPLPTAISFQSASTSQGGSCSLDSGTITCPLGTLLASATATVTLNTTAVAAGTLPTNLQVTTDSVDPDTTNNSGGGSLTVENVFDGRVAITDSANPATAGQSLQYTATVTNSGPDPMLSPTLSVNLSGAALLAANTTQGTCTVTATTASCTLSTLANGATATVTLNALPANAGTATASATISSAGHESNSTNNTASRATTVNAAASASGGGGGSMDLLSVFALLAIQIAWRLRSAGWRSATARSR